MTALGVRGVVPAKGGTHGASHHGFWNMDARFAGVTASEWE